MKRTIIKCFVMKQSFQATHTRLLLSIILMELLALRKKVILAVSYLQKNK